MRDRFHSIGSTRPAQQKYKFRFEFIWVENYADEQQGSGSDYFRFVTYGDTAKEAVEGHETLFNEWEKFFEKKSQKFIS